MKAQRRKERIYFLHAGLAVAGALSFTLATTLVLPLLQLLGCDTCNAKDVGEYILKLQKEDGLGGYVVGLVRELLLGSPVQASAMLGAFIAFLASLKYAGRLHDRFFAPFDDDVLTPIKAPRAFDPLRGAAGLDETDIPLPWLNPVTGPRRQIWEDARAFVETSLASKHIGFLRHEPRTPFGWAILVGPVGFGKSRVAVELARELCRRDL